MMHSMRKLVYYVAATSDGFIAGPDGGYDGFLQSGQFFDDLVAEFPETFPGAARGPLKISGPNRRFDSVLMGRATWEIGAKQGVDSPYPHLEQFVISSSLTRISDPAIKLVQSDAPAFVRELKQRTGKDIWLCGGGQLAAALFDEIDELILKLHPVLIGAGIPLFARQVPATRMRLLERKPYDDGFIRLHYALR